jgi:hypothetical protein
MSIKSAIYSTLAGSSAISAIVGTKIYPSVAPSSAVAPYIVYTVGSNLSIRTMQGASTLGQYRVQVSIFSFDSKTNTTLASALSSLLNTKRINGTGFSFTSFEDNSIESDQFPEDASEQFVFQYNVDYSVFYQES